MSFMNAPRDSQTGTVTITISPELEQQIFAETPGVPATYVVSIPHRRSRAELFTMLNSRSEQLRKKVSGVTHPSPHIQLSWISLSAANACLLISIGPLSP
jgi:hypothetical protein